MCVAEVSDSSMLEGISLTRAHLALCSTKHGWQPAALAGVHQQERHVMLVHETFELSNGSLGSVD